tara:strand:+ start:888 stop:1169 length:282 start_codon:yes stop_codon:yes gene_type:complete
MTKHGRKSLFSFTLNAEATSILDEVRNRKRSQFVEDAIIQKNGRDEQYASLWRERNRWEAESHSYRRELEKIQRNMMNIQKKLTEVSSKIEEE